MSPALSYFDKPAPPANKTAIKPHHDGFGTRAIHVGSEPDKETGAVITPIYLATTYKQDSVGNHKVCIRSQRLVIGPLTPWVWLGI